MNKAKLFLMAAAPAALIIPIEVQAAETESVKILGNNIVNSELTADTASLPKDKAITDYRWYYEDGQDSSGNTINTEIAGETTNKFTILPSLVDKTIFVKVTVEGGTEYISEKITVSRTLETTGDQFVNGTLIAAINNIADKPVIKSYQWYYIEAGKRTPILGATNIELVIPAEAAGKKLIVEAKSEVGKTYLSEMVDINPLKLKMDDPTFVGFSPAKYVIPGDTLQADEAKVEDENILVKLKPSQISYTYQWMYEVEAGSYSFIEGATSATYTIPADALDRKINKIAVRVTARVGTTVAEPKYSTFVEVSNNPAVSLNDKIKLLLTKDGDKIIYDIQEIGNIRNFEEEYSKLTKAAKDNVTNYPTLERALSDKKIMDALEQKVLAIDSITPETSRTKYIDGLVAEYEQLDLLQRSMKPTLYVTLQNAVKNSNTTYEITNVNEINQDILDLLKKDTVFATYNAASIEELETKIKKIEEDIAKLSKEYQTTVQNQDIIKIAKSDIKKVQSFIKSFAKLDLEASSKKQISTAKTIRSAYDKLTMKQRSLVPYQTYITDKLEVAEQAEDTKVSDVQALINTVITVDGSSIQYMPTDSDMWREYVKDVNKAVSDYKALTKDKAKNVENYSELLLLQKDLKIAEKVITQLDNYNKLVNVEGVTYSKKKSAYNSAVIALSKLTTLQKSLIYNQSLLGDAPVDDVVNESGKEPSEEELAAKALGEEFVGKIATAISTSKNDFETYAKAIEETVEAYKNLRSNARKYVTNYNLLKAAEKDVKGARGFLKKVDAAEMEGDAGKRYTKIQSVMTAYLKLPANQQILVDTDYNRLLELLEDKGLYTDLSALNDDIFAIIDDVTGLYTSFENIKKVEKDYNRLSSAEKKQITNYYILKQALADVKKVDAFMKKYTSMSEKTEATVLKGFKALSAKQASLVSETVRMDLIEKEKNQYDENTAALKLIDDINNLLENGEYVTGLEKKVEGLRGTYEGLSASQKTIVKNYSKLTQAESDLQKVKEVHALKSNLDLEAWQKAFNKLSRKLELLYNQIDTP